MVSPTEAHAAVERLTAACEYGKVWPSIGVKTADLALLLALLKEAGRVVGPFAEVTGIPEWLDDERVRLSADGSELGFTRLGNFRAAAKLAELLPSMEGE